MKEICQSSSDLLCQVLDYSPSMDSDVRYRTKVQLKENQTLSELLPPIESTIQIVEEAPIESDDKIIREELQSFLSKYGYEVVAPSEFENIVEFILNENANLVLLDIIHSVQV